MFYWFTKSAKRILEEHFNIDISIKIAEEIEETIDYDINGWNYFYNSIHSFGKNDISIVDSKEVIIWFIGSLRKYMKENKIGKFSELEKIFPPNYMHHFCKYVQDGKIPKIFSKEIFDIFITKFNIEKYQKTFPWEILDLILENPKFQLMDESKIDIMIDELIKTYPDKWIELKTNPKIKSWFVGQVMKQTNGKANGGDVLSKLESKLVA